MATYLLKSSMARFSGLFLNQGRIAVSRYTQPSSSIQQVCFMSKTYLEGEPKPPSKSYMIFCAEKRPEIKKENPGIKVTEIASKAGKMWKALPKAETEKYKQMYERHKAQYKEDLKKWKETFTEAEWEKLQEQRTKERIEKRKKKAKRALRKEWKLEGKPTKPGYAMSYFLKGKKGVITEHVAAWKALTDDEKQVYKDMYQKDFDQYKIKSKAWQEKMKKEGKLHLLPKRMQPSTDKKKKSPAKTTTEKTTASKTEDKKTSSLLSELSDSDYDSDEVEGMLEKEE